MLITGRGRKGRKIPPSPASCGMQPRVTSHPRGWGMLSWSRTPRVEQTPPPRREAEGSAGSGTTRLTCRGGGTFCFADESSMDVLGVVLCARSRGPWWCPCAAHSPGGGRTPLGRCRRGKTGTWGPQSPRWDRGTEPLPKTQPTAPPPAPCLCSVALPSCDPRFSFLKTAPSSVRRDHTLGLPRGCSRRSTEPFQESLASAFP